LAEIFATGIFAAAGSGARRPAACDLASRGLPGAYTDACQMVVHGLALFEGLYAGRVTARSEAMDAETYFAERMIRDRIADVRASAELARLLRQSTERSPRYSLGTRLFEIGRSLVKTARRVAFAISRARGNETHVAEHP